MQEENLKCYVSGGSGGHGCCSGAVSYKKFFCLIGLSAFCAIVAVSVSMISRACIVNPVSQWPVFLFAMIAFIAFSLMSAAFLIAAGVYLGRRF